MKFSQMLGNLFAVSVLVISVGFLPGEVLAQPVPISSQATAAAGALTPGIVPGSPLAEVVKLIQAGVDLPTIESYIANSQSPFNLDADEIIYLKDMGAPSEVINAMMDRDKVLYASTVTPQPPPQPPPPPPAPDTTDASDTTGMAPPPENVDMNYFNNSLTPYGSWITIDGYGQCWRPTAVIYDGSWRPYCDRGHWVYTDYGWYWDSDYAWGATFHYGRWFHHARFGWCWYPDTVWAPSWVTWRSDTDFCGWAPLPPFAVFTPGVGLVYQGASVAMDFDFGLGADSFMFVSAANFCDRHPKSYVVQQQYVGQIFRRTKVVNNFAASGKTPVNRGFGTEHIASVTHQAIAQVQVSTLANAGLQGWRGEGYQQTLRRGSAVNINPGNSTGGNNNNNGMPVHSGNTLQTQQGVQQGGHQFQNGQGVQNVPGNQGGQNGNANGQVRSQTYYNQHTQPAQTQQQPQPQPFQPPRQYNNNYTPTPGYPASTPGYSASQNQWHQNFNNNNNAGTASSGGLQQHGGAQLEQHQYTPTPTPQPREETHNNAPESNTRNFSPPPAPPAPPQNQPQPRYQGNGGNGKQNQ